MSNRLSLIDYLNIYEQEIMSIEYKYRSYNNLEIVFKIEPEDFCHLLLGTPPDSVRNKNRYKGSDGYNNIKNGIVTLDNLPHAIKDYSKHRMRAFPHLPKLLDKPSIYHFNKELVDKGKIPLKKTEIDIDYLLYKKIESTCVHFGIKNITRKKIVSKTLFHNTKETYIQNQIKLKVFR